MPSAGALSHISPPYLVVPGLEKRAAHRVPPAPGIYLSALRALFRILDQAVAPVRSSVNNRECSVAVLVPEREEAVLQQIHLKDCFLSGHGLHVELLRPDDLERTLLRAPPERRGGVGCADEGVLTESSGETRLVLADLPLDRGDRRVHRREHIRRALTGAEVCVGA